MNTITAKVNTRLLHKASRLFTGSLQGRIIEILQNARRAGATTVAIRNKEGVVTVRDNGQGIGDFAKLLDLGGSDWEQGFEASEDPAGVGIFCLAPREVTIRSNGQIATISADGWTGAPITVRDDPDSIEGTLLEFRDDAWTSCAVDTNAVYTGMEITVDGKECPSMPFVSQQAVECRELGCRIEVRQSQDLSPWHHGSKRERWMSTNVLVNFHGQVVGWDYHPVGEHYMNFLVDLTGDPTGIRLMLPARTCLVENKALDALKSALELEAYRYIQRRWHHRLPYSQYLRALELKITLPEAEPTFKVGLLSGGDFPEPVEVRMPEGFPLAKCYRLAVSVDDTNVHLLAALGTFEEPFVPVDIKKTYEGYSWAKLPFVERVEVQSSKQIHQDWVWCGTLSCVESLSITARTSDGKEFSSLVCMAVSTEQPPGASEWASDHVLITPEARDQLAPSEIWYHLGGWSDEGDTYDTQEFMFEEELQRFWTSLYGPDEQLRRRLLTALQGFVDWESVTILSSGSVTVRLKDGSTKKIESTGHRKSD